jgi:hypothetical protein
MPLSAVPNRMILVFYISAILCLATINKLLKNMSLNGAAILSLKQLGLSKLLSVLNEVPSERSPISIWSIFIGKEMCLQLLLTVLFRTIRSRKRMKII